VGSGHLRRPATRRPTSPGSARAQPAAARPSPVLAEGADGVLGGSGQEHRGGGQEACKIYRDRGVIANYKGQYANTQIVIQK